MLSSDKRKFFWSLLLTVICGGLWLGVGFTLAQTTPDLGLAQVGEGIGLPATDIRLIVARIIRAALGLLGIVALGLTLYAGFTWMTAGGNEDKIATAKKILFNAAIGLVIILSAFAIVSFVISNLISATTGLPAHCSNGVIDAGEEGVDCGGECPACGGGTTPYGPSNVFYVKQKPSGFTCIRNYYPLVVFNHPVNLSTLENNLIVRRQDNQEQAVGTWQFASETIQNIVKFVPEGDCGSPPNDCLEASTLYELYFANASAIKSQTNLTLNCSLDATCATSEFTTGESVDRQPPTVIISSPADSSNLEKGTTVPVNVSYWDDNGIQNISLFDNEYYVDSVQVSNCETTGSVTINWPTASAVMTTHTLETIGFDWSAATGTDSVVVYLRPSHCFNNIQDVSLGEIGIDCGGECGLCGGSACSSDGECASGYCEIPPGVCVNKMIITNIDPMAGATGTTYVTISGRYFGENGGHVYFTKIGGGWAEAPIVSCGSGIDNWTQSQLIVSVPNNAADGAIKVETATTPLHDSFVDVTDGSDNWGGIYYFDVNNQQRPGLCNLQPKSGAPYTTNVTLTGINFGGTENRVVFGAGTGAFNALIKNWSNALINAKVPGMAPGTVGVKVIAMQGGGEEVSSNGMAFTVTEDINLDTPIIFEITPNKGAKGQYITIIGKNFGSNKGKVYFKLNGDQSGILGDFNFPDECGSNFWTDTKIIVKFPQAAIEIPGEYSVQVQRSTDNALSPIGAYFQAQTGSPGPGICKIDPVSGPVPFAEGKYMELIGEHLIGAQPYFWRAIASSSTIEGRLPASVETWSENNIFALPPAMALSGPVVVYRASDSKMSNSINFTVFNCLENNNTCTQAENKCCLQGTDAGMCIPKNEMCDGETRSTGYMWRFGTRDLPVVPRVIERCNSDTELALNIPSPSPSTIWNTGGVTDHVNVCRTALVTVVFNTAINPTTVDLNNVQIFKCVSSTINKNICTHDGGSISLNPESYVLHNDTSELSDDFYLTIKPDTVGGAWSDETWYQVILKSDIRAEAVAAGSLMATRPCGSGTSYCFIFKTDSTDCRLKEVVVTPLDYWTGVLERPIQYRKVKDNADDPGVEFWYRGNGLSEQKCVWMNMDSYSWNWGVSSENYASIYFANQNQAQVSALANTVAVGLADDAVRVRATASKGAFTVPPPPSIDISDGLVGWWNFDDDGAKVVDNSGNYHDGTPQSGVTYISPGKIGTALNLNGSAAVILDNPTVGFPSGMDSRTICAWGRPTDTAGGWRWVFAYGDGVEGRAMFIGQNGTSLDGGAYGADYDIIVNNFWQPGVWHHVCLTYDGDAQVANLYTDGAWNTSMTLEWKLKLNRAYIGAQVHVSPNEFWKGAIDDVRIYDKALSAGEVAAVYNNLSAAPTPTVTSPESKTGEGLLHIDLSQPKVLDYWPKCLSACTNAEIGAKFNTIMANYNLSAVKLYKCSDENCLSKEDITSGINPLFKLSDRRYLEMPLISGELEKNTIYQIVLSASGTSTSDGVNQLWSGASTTNDVILSKPYQQEFTWRFRTKQEKCQPSKVNILPPSYVASYIKEKAVYTAEAFTSPDDCNPNGQRLNPWLLNWNWTNSSNAVATIQTFVTKGHNNLCTAKCLKKGSDILFGSSVIEPICGNGIVEAGEDCDVPEKITGVSACGLNCLYLGNTSSTCGNGIIETNLGEECDLAVSQGCSSNCLNMGSNQYTGAEEIGASICGNNQIGFGEDCDIGVKGDRLVVTSSLYCSEKCLHLGTPLSAKWCYDNVATYGGFSLSEFTTACQKAISQCGDGVVSPNEECDAGIYASSTCSTNCLLLSNCTVGMEGCTTEGQLAGSSLMYSVPSVCGDAIQGIGEAIGCEQGFVISHTFNNPWVLATGVGDGPTIGLPPTQQTTITGQATAFSVSGEGKFIIPCGYHSDSECNAGDASGSLGVAQNTCCYSRPQIIKTYPVMSPLPVNVCPNTYIEIKFNKKIDPSTLYGNLILAQGRTAASCLSGEENVTGNIITTIVSANSDIWYKKVWKQIVWFVKNLFQSNTASAFKTDLNSVSWCAGKESITTEVVYDPSVSSDSNDVTSTVKIILKKALATSTDYAVILRPGIKDSRGVSIGVLSGDINRNWKFITGEQICELTDLSINPATHLFQKAGNSINLEVVSKTGNGQQIQPINGYRWEYVWEPKINDYVTLTVTTSTPNVITSKNRNGEIDVVAESKFTENIFTATSPTLRGSSHITIFLCENPWPSVADLPWHDTAWDFSTYYCRDSGSVGTADDLPNLSASVEDSLTAPYRRRYLMTDKDFTDAIGIMIFPNPEHLTVQDWYKMKNFKGTFTSLNIDGYSAITDGNNYYVDALNLSSSENIYTNIYLFSINSNAEQNMRRVFEQMITNLKFNNDFLNEKYCGSDFVDESVNYSMPCQNDLDCWTQVDLYNQTNPLTPSTDYLCLNQKDKIQRNYQRLKDVRTIIDVLSNYNQNQQIINSSTLGFYPLMKDNTYLSGQALSVWPAAWTGLGSALGASMPSDPINKLAKAGTCFQKNISSQFTACTKDENCAVPVTDGIVSQWLSDQNPTDQKGISDAQLEGDVSYSAGKGHGDAFDIAGDSVSKLIIPHKDNYNTESFTLSTWIYPRKKNTAVLFQKGGLSNGGASLGGWGLEYSDWSYYGDSLSSKVFNNGTVRFAIYPSDSSDYKYVAADSGVPLALNQWHHLAAVYDSTDMTNRKVRLYIDGLPASAIEPDGWIMKAENKAGVISVVNNADLSNNGLNIEVGQNFNGLIDNTIFYNKALNLDEVNNLYRGVCIIHDSLTGWSVEDRRFSFSCNPLSYAYRYIYDTVNRDFDLRLNIEEDGINPANWPIFISEFGIDSGSQVSMDSVCQADDEVASPYSLVCGDGVLGGTEVCDPPGKVNYDTSLCPVSATKKICNSSCQWGLATTITCAAATGAQCGDGKIQAVTGEVCDDGLLNGTNERCNTTCTGIVHNCGDYLVQTDELCDPTYGRKIGSIAQTGWCVGGQYFTDLIPVACSLDSQCPYTGKCNKTPDDKYGLLKNNSCNWDCKSYGPYCGDGQVQEEWGENCETNESCSTVGVSGSKKCNTGCRYDNAGVEGIISYWGFDYYRASDGLIPDDNYMFIGTCKTGVDCPSLTSGIYNVNRAFKFNGAQYVQIKNYSSSLATKTIYPQFTVEAWVKPDSDNTYHARVFEEGGQYNNGGYGLEFRTYDDININNFRCTTWDVGNILSKVDSNPVNTNEWHHVVCTFNGATYGIDKIKGILSIYVDGVLQEATSTAVMAKTTYPLCFGSKCVKTSLGGYTRSAINAFKGLIDNVAYYSRALPLEEIQEHYAAVNGWYCTAGGKTPEYSTCGNKVVEEEEVCDMGDKNGAACIPQYPYTSCTYCSADCKSVITVDTMCGNGVWDYAGGEECDFSNILTDFVRNYTTYLSDRCFECQSNCTFKTPPILNTHNSPCDLHGLGYCGDNIKNGWEYCDGTDWGSYFETSACYEDGYWGYLTCNSCLSLDCIHGYCGDGIIQSPPEECDGAWNCSVNCHFFSL